MMNRRHVSKTPSRPSSPQQDDCGSLNVLVGGYVPPLPQHHGQQSPNKRLWSPKSSRYFDSIWGSWMRFFGGMIVASLFVCWILSARWVLIEPHDGSSSDNVEHRNLKTWIQTHALQPIQLKLRNFQKHLNEHLRGSGVSKKGQKQIVKLFSGASKQEQKEVMQILKHVLNDEEFEEDATEHFASKDGQKEDDTKRRDLEREEFEALKEQVYKQASRPLRDNKNADRHIQLFLDIAYGDLCKDPVVDFSDPNYHNSQAVEIFDKCRLLVIKNAYDKKLLEEYRDQYAQFIQGLKEGKISRKGSNTGGDSVFMAGRGRGRYDIVLPERLAHPDIVANPKILDVVQHWKLLGANSGLRSLETLVAEGYQGGGTPGQPWHFDTPFLFGQERGGLSNYGIAGHDLPPVVVSMAIPFLDMTRDLGPTEFCVGSSALNGVGPDVTVLNETLVEEGSLFRRYYQHSGKYCPAECWRAPLLNFGDAVMWNYGVRHRGGWNASPYLRSNLLLIYAKRWFDDTNFGDKTRKYESDDESPVLKQVLARTRFALPERDEPLEHPVTTPLKQIAHIYPNELYEAEAHRHEVEYIATNWNVDGNPTLFVNNVPQGYLPAGSTRTVQARYGDVMELRLGSGIVVGRFTCSDDGQFVFTNDATY
ncbi:hypothetical protein ACA910_014821 [Epithemia clementina (nom. ined.)]